VPLDVPSGRVADVVAFMRHTDAFLGANVTVPYKEAVAPLLDQLGPAAQATGAVNTILRAPGGRLIGANTDGVGLVAALLRPFDGPPLVESLYGLTVLLVGAGGAARATAVALAGLLGHGQLFVANRTLERARAVAATAEAYGGRAAAVPEDAIDDCLHQVDVVVNASVRGQAGILRLTGGWTHLEPYSALAPAHPALLPAPDPAVAPEIEGFLRAWWVRSADDVRANHARSRARVRLLPGHAVVYDMVYAPRETITMRHAREAGLRAANGRWMNIAQAVEAFVEHVCAKPLADAGLSSRIARDLVTRAMAEAWDTTDA
jgi:shikimate 5-dehydrogenase